MYEYLQYAMTACIHTHPDPINILDGGIYMDSSKCTHPFHCLPSVFASHVSFYSPLECLFYNLSERLASPFPLFNRNGEIFCFFYLTIFVVAAVFVCRWCCFCCCYINAVWLISTVPSDTRNCSTTLTLGQCTNLHPSKKSNKRASFQKFQTLNALMCWTRLQ